MIALRAGRLRCELQPGLGGAIAGLWRDDVPLLCSTPAAALASARRAACLPLVPFSNGVEHATVLWEGTLQPQVRHGGDVPSAIHGVAAQRPWTLLDADDGSAMLAYEHRGDNAWPFAFDCSHTVRLRPDGLELTLALTNQAGRPAPAGVGWRIAFLRGPGSTLQLQATGRWEFDADQLPVRRLPATGLQADGATLPADACFDGWSGTVQVRDARCTLRLQSELTRLLLHADPAGDRIALSPVSHVPNAVQLHAAGAPAADLGLAILQPGESLVAQMRIAVEDTP